MGNGPIDGVSLGKTNRTTAFNRIQNHLAPNNNNTHPKVSKGATGPSIYGFGFAADKIESHTTGATNM